MIDFIELQGKQYPVKFGMNTLRIFTKQFHISLNKLGNIGEMDFDVLLELMFAGIKEGLRSENQPLELTIDSFCDSLNEKGKFEDLMEIFADQFGGGEKEGNLKAQPKKKKSVGTK